MPGVDDKVVGMRFDNQGFQDKIKETLASLDKLKGSLDFANSTRGMQELNAAAGRFSMGNMASQVQGVSAGFVALGTMAVTTLMNITNRAIDAGIAFAKSITTAPIMQGFQEFELKMGSIQTIMSGSGASLQTVNEKLQQLNAYSDKTIYSFADMTSNIGKFTNAGVDLDTSVNAIQGVANVAALAGANSGEASRAMYNFAQAISTGSVKLIDWKSIELANMGTVEFKQQLIDTSVAMGTLTKQGDKYITSAGTAMSATEGFNQSLTDEWLTSEVLTGTLSKFADETTDIGKRATAAATEIKTFSMMVDTMKESVGSGWATTFETVIGDFEEGKALWTEINSGFENLVGKSAEARNEMLKGWKELGGRETLLQGFRNAIEAVGAVLKPIKEAFRDIFPPMTAERLFQITQTFQKLTDRLIISGETAEKIKSIFSGVFSLFKIGWEVVKGIVGVFGDLIGSIGGSTGGVLTFAAGIGDTVTKFQEMLVEGGGIKRFFENISNIIKNPVEAFEKIQAVIADLINDFPGFAGASGLVEGAAKRLGDRFSGAAELIRKMGDAAQWVGDRLSGIIGVLDTVWGHISTWMGELKEKLAELWAPSDFDGAVDAVGVGLLGGIALMLKKFFKNGLSFDFTGGVMEKITSALDGVTGALKTMQADLRAKALMKIAIAMGILTVSIIALSLIDSAALAKALAAIAVGFGQLVVVMALMEKASMGTSAMKIGGLATGMILMATAMAILSVAIKNLSSLGWEELAKGLIGVGVGMGIMITGMNMLTSDTGGMIRAGLGMAAMALGLLALSYAVKSFSDMSWAEMAKGMVGVGVGLALMVGAMNLMPVGGMISAGIGMIAISAGLIVLAEAVKSFSELSWSEMAKGMVGIGAGLVIIAAGMHLMPLSLPLTAAGMVILSAALIVLSQAVKMIGETPLGELTKGLGGLAIMLGILAVAMIAMTGTAAGAAATLVAAGALVILTGVLKTLGKMSLAELAIGLGAIAAVLAVLGIAAALLTPVVPVLMSLGLALLVIGGAFALFGVGAMMMAKAFEVIAKAGKAGLGVLLEMIEMVIQALPRFISAFIQALVDLATEIIAAVPTLIKVFHALLSQILDTIIELVPKIVEALGTIITGFLTLVAEQVPLLIETGFTILLAILQGIRDNIAEIVTLAIEILTTFVTTVADNMPMIVGSAVLLLTSFLSAVAARASDIVKAGVDVLVQFLSGVRDNLAKVVAAVGEVITTFITEVGKLAKDIVKAGLGALTDFLKGISENLGDVIKAVGKVITTFITEVGNLAGDIIEAGLGALTDFLEGIGNNLGDVINTVTSVVTTFITQVGNMAGDIATAGADALIDFLDGVSNDIDRVIDKGVEVIDKFIRGVADSAVRLANSAADALVDFLNGLADAIEKNMPRIRGAGARIANALVDGLVGGLADGIRKAANAAVELAKAAWDAAMNWLGIKSPSRKFIYIGQQMARGMTVALNKDTTAENASASLAKRTVNAFQESMERMQLDISNINEFSPTITPVLDLTKVRIGAKSIDDLMGMAAINPSVSTNAAREISTTAETTGTAPETPVYSGPAEVTFEQNIYSPTALSTNDIYRSTKSQIALAKEELNI